VQLVCTDDVELYENHGKNAWRVGRCLRSEMTAQLGFESPLDITMDSSRLIHTLGIVPTSMEDLFREILAQAAT
jgi:hypothetical protein